MTDADAQAIVGGLDETWSATASACEGLHPDAWDLSTDCPGWSVRDHLSHLIGTELSLLGEKAPPAPDPMPAYVKNPIGEGNEAWINARRATPGTEILEEFVEVTARRLAELRSLDDARWDTVGWSPIGQAPYRDYMRIRLFDSWVHGQDVRIAVGRPGDRFGRGESVSLDRVALGMPFVVGRKVAPPDGASVVFDVTGPLARTLAIVMDGGRAGVADTTPTDPTVTLTMPSAHFIRLGCGREAADDALGDPDVAVHGDEALGRAVVAAMAFMI